MAAEGTVLGQLCAGSSKAFPTTLLSSQPAWLAPELLLRVQSRVLTPGVWEGGLVPAEQGTGTALPCSVLPICSCKGSTAAWEPLGAAGQRAEMGSTPSSH